MANHTKAYIALVSTGGVAAMAYAFLDPQWSGNIFRFAMYFLLSLLAATLKLRLPGLTQTMSLGFIFVLIGITELTLSQTMLMACTGVLVQCLWRAKSRPSAVQVFFSISAVADSLLLASQCTHFVRQQLHVGAIPIVIAMATCVYFVANSLLVSGVLSLVKRQPLRAVWEQCYLYAFPYYSLGGVVVALIVASGREFGWQPPLALLSVMGLAFLFYRIHLGRLAAQSMVAGAPTVA